MNNLILSPSGLDEYSYCGQRYFYSKEARFVPNDPNPALVTGSFVHLILEKYYLAIMRDKKIPRLPLMESIIEWSVLKRKDSPFLYLDDDTYNNVINSFRQYVAWYASDGWMPIENGVESPFTKILWTDPKLDLNIVIQGIIDLRAANAQGERIIIDHKSAASHRWRNRLANQPLAYAWAEGVPNVMINEFGLQKSYGPEKKFFRDDLSYSKDDILEWQQDTIELALRLYSDLKSNVWDKRGRGNSACERCSFFPICNMSAEGRDWKLSMLFHKEEAKDIFV